MPTPEEGLALAEEKFRQFLVLADEVLALRRNISERLETALHDGAFQNSRRNSVLVGLSIKALDCFDRLLVDARERRAECSHHLKTMAECFIYSGWVSNDAGETRAKILVAEGYRSRTAYHKAVGEIEHEQAWKKMQQEILEGLQSEFKSFRDGGLEQVAKQGNRIEQYHQVYRLACEAAHMADLTVYMPPQPTEAGLRLSDLSFLRAYVCLKFGIILACDLLYDAADKLRMGIDRQIDGFRDRWRGILALTEIPNPSQSHLSPTRLSQLQPGFTQE